MAAEHKKIEFSLLDFGLRDPSMNSLRIIEDVIEYAQAADRLGYKRVWLAEHHIPDTTAAWYNPFPLLPIIAGMTKRIRIGIAGTQLTLHNPYHIAVDYKLLENLFPERIDLGLATGFPSDKIRALVGNETLSIGEKKSLVIKLLKEEDRLALEEEFILPPYKGSIPSIWLLLSSYSKLGEVIDAGVNFSRSLFHGTDLNCYKDQLEQFKEQFYAKHQKHPEITLAVAGCCHYTDKKAQQISENANYKGIQPNICGSIERFKDTILGYQQQYGYDEFTFLNMARLPKDRQIAIHLIQEAFDL
jgi:alkanesulfonate monooxygenase SsuD/methylene tetrahydromethanopterin reductase-like flavin-dependent oxidoreductase (luciferase family)